MERVQCVVAGAGVVGLAIARALAILGKQVLVLEAAHTFGSGISSRNSEVVHAGLYYAKGSLKATLCVRGKRLLYDFAKTRGVPFRRCGKIVVATSRDQIATLDAIKHRALDNGVDDVKLLDAEDVRRLEPEVRCLKALLSPSTGIVDAHAFMGALMAEAEDAGCLFSFRTRVLGGKLNQGKQILVITDQGEIACDQFFNCAGLSAVALMRNFSGFPTRHLPDMYFAKGNYFKISRRPFQRLVYPVPENGGLGVHATIDLQGQVRFGPDVEWIRSDGDPANPWVHTTVPEFDYTVDPRRGDAFYAEVRKYWPELADGALQPDYAGVRPKLQAPGGPAVDFVVQGPESHEIQGLVNLFGIESPGLTSSLALAEHAIGLVR